MPKLLITGANGVVGNPLVQRLKQLGFEVVSVSRRSAKISSLQWNLSEDAQESHMEYLGSANVVTLIHCAPIWLLPRHLSKLASVGIQRMLVFSSTSVVGKRDSLNAKEQHLVEQLANSENTIKNFCLDNKIDLTIFRPSMIYGYCLDQNITRIAHFIKRYKLFFVVAEAKGLRQPIHADDLVKASLAVLENPDSFGQTYNLAGAEVLSYRLMVQRIFNGLKHPPRIIALPLGIYRTALKIAALGGRFSYTAEMADRMNQNLIYDFSKAQKDFGYAPQKFLTNPERDLP
ncbi:MAG: NAD-dependent epimerase/dehydratase family protein [Acidiferrobacterales bacterium]|nr:NAD-dependent epimerase/dehydratase family protein [Acidiferrobacterales bacterium]